MGRLFSALLAGALAMSVVSNASAGDAKAGRAIVEEKCVVCHGLDGIAKIAEAPNLAGQNETYLNAQLNAFKSGARQNDMMSIVAQALNDTDVANLASYYSSIPITVGKPPGG